jgi:EAL domain-containing protein (putative c-di-GMP-specific phosphodiesterase class I)
MRVIAEGVEREEQLSLLTRLGRGLVQGYYIGRPGNAKETTALLKNRVAFNVLRCTILVLNYLKECR